MSENPNLENLLQMGITAAREGNREAARVMFRQVLDEDKKNERAWIWLASVAESKIKRQQYLQTVLKINPNNKSARTAIRKMSSKRSKREQRTLMTGVVLVLIILVVATLLCLVAVASV